MRCPYCTARTVPRRMRQEVIDGLGLSANDACRSCTRKFEKALSAKQDKDA